MPAGNPDGGVMPAILDVLVPRLSPEASSSLASLSRFLNALKARFNSSSVAIVGPPCSRVFAPNCTIWYGRTKEKAATVGEPVAVEYLAEGGPDSVFDDR